MSAEAIAAAAVEKEFQEAKKEFEKLMVGTRVGLTTAAKSKSNKRDNNAKNAEIIATTKYNLIDVLGQMDDSVKGQWSNKAQKSIKKDEGKLDEVYDEASAASEITARLGI